ncbi:retrovirus-related Pol polyprotein from transposon 17.6 [Trichonephila clavipes]|nr:retrovirus-related Pol polyprotein from transposon 17.6 [Trichonephila clavipes]
MNKALSCYREFSRAYIDDIAIFSKKLGEHLLHLDTILKKLSELNFTVNLKKCAFGKLKLNIWVILSVLVSTNQIPKRLQLSTTYQCLKRRRSFSVLGLCNYYREYIPKYSELVYPLTELTKKRVPDSIPWTEKHDSSFHLLKKALVEAPSLYSPVPDKTVYHSFRCIANWHSCLPVTKKCGDKCYPIAYASQKLSKTQQSWSTIEREAFAIVWSLKKFEVWVFGTEIEFLY